MYPVKGFYAFEVVKLDAPDRHVVDLYHALDSGETYAYIET